MKHRVGGWLWWCSLACLHAALPAAMAQVSSDPTRPPAEFLSPSPGGPGAAPNSLLQSVKISGAERSAIIGGQTVKLGGKYGDARVVKITESEVVLRSASGTETLKMYPGVDMKQVAVAAPAASTAPAKKRSSATKIRGAKE